MDLMGFGGLVITISLALIPPEECRHFSTGGGPFAAPQGIHDSRLSGSAVDRAESQRIHVRNIQRRLSFKRSLPGSAEHEGFLKEA